MAEANTEGLSTAHRKPGQRAILSSWRNTIAGLGPRHDFFEQIFFHQWRVPGLYFPRRAERNRMAERHDDDHRPRFFFRDQVVEDQIRASRLRPTLGGITAAVQKVQHGKALLLVLFIV